MTGDWIKLHRKALDSEVFTDAWLWQLWCWCLLRANWKPKKFRGVQLAPGQFATGKHAAAECLNVSPSKFYRGLRKLEVMGQVAIRANNRFTVVTICHWATYQNGEDREWTTDGQPTDSQWTASGHRMDTIEEGKNSKEGKNNPPPLAREEKFDEQIVDPALAGPEFREAWHRWVRWVDSQNDRPMDFARAERDLMECSRRGRDKAIRDIEFTIAKDGSRRLLDSDLDFDRKDRTTTGQSPNAQRRGVRSVAELLGKPSGGLISDGLPAGQEQSDQKKRGRSVAELLAKEKR